MNIPWYKNAIMYSLDVETFLDSDGNGTGDFKGLIRALDYISGLGVTSLWLLPFYPSPNRDNGYDVMDYCAVDPRLGSMEDFQEFIKKTGELGIKVIIDMVVNHSSNQHEWFKQARYDKNSKYRNYYIWSRERPANIHWDTQFPGEEEHVWSYDEIAGEFYLHRFYKEQPDLNVANPELKEEIGKIIKFWLNLGVSGFRIDAAHILVQLDHPSDSPSIDFNILNFIHDAAVSSKEDIVLLAEADDSEEKIQEYYGNGDRMNVLFNFLLNQQMFLALAREKAESIIEQVNKLLYQPDNVQWLNFIRHHDELILARLSPEEREEVYAKFAASKEMQIYNRGIRRRLAPMFNNDRRLMELINSLTFSFPGIPLIRYGDEIGMGDDLSLPGRNSIRTPMQWNDQSNGGFSEAHPKDLVKPVIPDGEFGYQRINVQSQHDDSASFLNWIKKLVSVRKDCPEIGLASFGIIPCEKYEILIHCFTGEQRRLVVFHNLSEKKAEFSFQYPLKDAVILLSDSDYLAEKGFNMELNPYGYMWVLMEQSLP